MKKTRLIAILCGMVACTATFASYDEDNEKNSGWLKTGNTKYEIQSVNKVTATGGEFGDNAAFSALAFVLKTDNSLPILTLSLKAADIPTGTWELPCKEASMVMLGYGSPSNTHFSLPLTKEEFLSIDKCPKAHELIGGTLKIARSGGIYEIEIRDAKLMKTMHNGDPNASTHPKDGITVSAYFKGKLGIGEVPGDECSALKLPAKFKMKYELESHGMSIEMEVIKIGDDLYEKQMSTESFYKHTPQGWDKYTYDSFEKEWIKAEIPPIACPYTDLLITWKKSHQRDYPKVGTEMFLGIDCSKYHQNVEEGKYFTFWVHPDYDIILNQYSNYFGTMRVEASEFTTHVGTWIAETGKNIP